MQNISRSQDPIGHLLSRLKLVAERPTAFDGPASLIPGSLALFCALSGEAKVGGVSLGDGDCLLVLRTGRLPSAVRPQPGCELLFLPFAHGRASVPGLLARLPELVELRADAGGFSLRATSSLLGMEISGARAGWAEAGRGLAQALLVQVLRSHGGGPSVAPGAEIQQALRLMRSDPSGAWTCGLLASLVGLSRATFYRRFKASQGLPPAAYLSGLRMELAKTLLEKGELDIARIARSAGYRAPESFARAFKADCGVSPSRWRMNART